MTWEKEENITLDSCVCVCAHECTCNLEHAVARPLSSYLHLTQLLYTGVIHGTAAFIFQFTHLSSHPEEVESAHNNGQVGMQFVITGEPKSVCMEI